MDVVWAMDDRDAGVILAFVILRQVSVIDLSVTMPVGKIDKSIAMIVE
jgi:hypothetical protein